MVNNSDCLDICLMGRYFCQGLLRSQELFLKRRRVIYRSGHGFALAFCYVIVPETPDRIDQGRVEGTPEARDEKAGGAGAKNWPQFHSRLGWEERGLTWKERVRQ